jgi:hypothetical protein
MDELTEAQKAIVDEYRLNLARLMNRTAEKLHRTGMDFPHDSDAVYVATERMVEDGFYATLTEFGE